MAEDQRVLFSTQHEMQIKHKVPLQQSSCWVCLCCWYRHTTCDVCGYKQPSRQHQDCSEIHAVLQGLVWDVLHMVHCFIVDLFKRMQFWWRDDKFVLILPLTAHLLSVLQVSHLQLCMGLYYGLLDTSSSLSSCLYTMFHCTEKLANLILNVKALNSIWIAYSIHLILNFLTSKYRVCTINVGVMLPCCR